MVASLPYLWKTSPQIISKPDKKDFNRSPFNDLSKNKFDSPIEKYNDTEYDTVFPENSEIVFLNIVHQEANHKQADNKGCHTSDQENSRLSTSQGVSVNKVLNCLKTTVTKHGWNTKEEGEVSSYATTSTNDDPPKNSST